MPERSAKQTKRVLITVPVKVWAYVRWQAALDGVKQEKLVEEAIRHYHKTRKEEHPGTPGLE